MIDEVKKCIRCKDATDKVKELVEWVARVNKSEIQSYSCKVCDECANAIASKVAKQILSHPDLALIDRKQEECEVCHGKGFYTVTLYGGTAAAKRDCLRCNGAGKIEVCSVIPLREAIKKSDD